jgi:hypothetical protein
MPKDLRWLQENSSAIDTSRADAPPERNPAMNTATRLAAAAAAEAWTQATPTRRQAMYKISWIVRLMAFGASATVTFMIVTALAEYGLPADSTARLLAQARPAVAK